MPFHKLAAIVAVLGLAAAASAQSTRPATRPAPPPDADAALQALKDSPRHGEWVDIKLDGGPAIKTYIVYPERPDKAPVVMVIHEIFGMSDWVRGVADALAAQGFLAVAPDLLSGMGPGGGGTDSFPDGQVRQAIRALTPEKTKSRLDAVRGWAISQPSAAQKVGVVGFCWGGSASFNYAAQSAPGDLQAAVVYYGTAPADVSTISAPVLGFYGRDDARVTSTVEPTVLAMAQAAKVYELEVFAGAGHGFLRQQSGRGGANLKAAEAAWPRTVAFFRGHLEDK